MASDTHTDKKGNESSSTKDERTDVPSSVNTFANDGSFLELFKKRMEKESQKLQNKGQAVDVDEDDSENKVGAREEKQPDRKALGTTKTLTQQGKRTYAVGKMGGASKQIHAKKMKKEKEAAEAAKKVEEEVEGKSSAWKAYMDEVKKYKEMSCSDDSDIVRPLVK